MASYYAGTAATSSFTYMDSSRYPRNDIDPKELGKMLNDDIKNINVVHNPMSTWTRLSGQSIYVTEMNDNHLVNSIKKCKRDLQRPMEIPVYQQLLLEAIRRNLIDVSSGDWDADENY